MTRVVKPVMIKTELVPRAIECRLQCILGYWKYATVQRTRQALQDLQRARRETNGNIDYLFRIPRILYPAQKCAAFL